MLQNKLEPKWKGLLHPLSIGLILGIGGFFIMLTGYGVLIYYSWFLILPFILVLGIAFRIPRSFQVYLIRVGLITVMASLLTALGLGLLITKKQSICSGLDSMISELENHRKVNGTYPPDLSALNMPGGLSVRVGRATESGISLEGYDDSDAVCYLWPDHFLCIVPITKKLPLSITRFYAYRWSTDEPRWRLDKLIWAFGIGK